MLTKGQDLTVCLSEAVDSAHSDVRDLSFQLGQKEIGLNFSGFNIWTEGDLDDAQGNSYLILKTETASNYKIQMRATTKMLDEYQKGDTAQDLGLTFPHTNVHEVKTDAISGRIEISSEKNGLVFYSTVDGNQLEITLWSKRTLTTNDVRFFELMISSIEVVSKGKSV
ncbi:hypothetical protein ACFFIF_09875 [Vagococcus entomophilus]|uniref:Uncharacterized protein n=1 Tax=Vagococcus entomophilus TaxID=1160095 RepID=A0A430AGA7_9ENTE|nr:hypothetical protein [Vagococcus entomophilus]RSU06946.1 hypothetical protein CBF30_06710 [Vagococcus entomophilus]